jgi:MFS family permease
MSLRSITEGGAARPKLATRGFIVLLVALGMGVAGWMPTNSFLSVFVRDELEGSVLSAAFLVMGIHVGGALFGLTASAWIGRFGSKSAFVVGLGGQIGFLAILGLLPDIRWAIPLAPIAGMFLAYHWTGMQAYLMEVAPKERRGLASGTGSLVVVLSPGISGLFLSRLAAEGGFSLFMTAAAVLVGIAFLVALVALPRVLHAVEPVSWPRDHRLGWPVRTATAAARSAQESVSGSFRSLLGNRMILLAMVVRLASALSFGVFNMLAGPKLVDAGGGFESLGLFVFGGAVAGGTAQVLVGSLSDRFGRRRLLAISAAIAVGSSIAFGLVGTIPFLLVASSLHWFSQSAFQTLLVALVGDIVPRADLGRAMTLQTSSFSAGMFTGVLIAGLLATVSIMLAFFVTAAFLSIGLLATIAMPTTGVAGVQTARELQK